MRRGDDRAGGGDESLDLPADGAIRGDWQVRDAIGGRAARSAAGLFPAACGLRDARRARENEAVLLLVHARRPERGRTAPRGSLRTVDGPGVRPRGAVFLLAGSCLAR